MSNCCEFLPGKYLPGLVCYGDHKMVPKQIVGQRLICWEEQGKLFRLESTGQG